jgi:CRISPR-associated endonuclease Cas1
LVATEGSLLSITNGRLRVATPDGRIHEQPLRTLAAVLLIGRQRLTGPTLTTALEAGVPVHFATRGGRYQGVLANHRPGSGGVGLWLRQAELFGNAEFALPLARELVSARIHNQTEVLRQRARGDQELEEIIGRLRVLHPKAPRATGRAELNGIEGAAAREFFQAMTRILPQHYGFTGRHRRPPPDPVNALLSLGYTLLYQRADTVLRAAGLLPEQGFYHQGHGRHAPLASDLMECFRHLVERQTLSMINRGELKPSDFVNDDAIGYRLSRPALASYLSALSNRFITPLEDATSGARGSLYDHLWRLSRCLIDQVDGRANAFQAFRVK